jgi:hypothetical protein
MSGNADYDALKGALHDEIAANLAFREKGGALPDEDMPTFCNRLLMERSLLHGENERLRREIDDSFTKMRDRLARKAMPHFFGISDAAGRARLAYQEADAMLAARCLNESRARLRAACEASGPLLRAAPPPEGTMTEAQDAEPVQGASGVVDRAEHPAIAVKPEQP